MSKSQSRFKSLEEMLFDLLFDSFAKGGDRQSDGISLQNIEKWFKQANLTTTDISTAFSKIAQNKQKITKEEFLYMLAELAKIQGQSDEEIQTKLLGAGQLTFEGSIGSTAGNADADVPDRLFNPLSASGSQKEAFGEESSEKGLAGRQINDDLDFPFNRGGQTSFQGAARQSGTGMFSFQGTESLLSARSFSFEGTVHITTGNIVPGIIDLPINPSSSQKEYSDKVGREEGLAGRQENDELEFPFDRDEEASLQGSTRQLSAGQFSFQGTASSLSVVPLSFQGSVKISFGNKVPGILELPTNPLGGKVPDILQLPTNPVGNKVPGVLELPTNAFFDRGSQNDFDNQGRDKGHAGFQENDELDFPFERDSPDLLQGPAREIEGGLFSFQGTASSLSIGPLLFQGSLKITFAYLVPDILELPTNPFSGRGLQIDGFDEEDREKDLAGRQDNADFLERLTDPSPSNGSEKEVINKDGREKEEGLAGRHDVTDAGQQVQRK